MDESNVKASPPIEELVSSLRRRGFVAECDREGRWMWLRGLRLGNAWSSSTTEVLIRFEDSGASPVILVPQRLSLKPGMHVCDRLLQEHTYLKGWRRLCPHMIEDVGEQVLEFVVCLAGLLASPDLCGALGCDAAEARSA